MMLVDKIKKTKAHLKMENELDVIIKKLRINQDIYRANFITHPKIKSKLIIKLRENTSEVFEEFKGINIEFDIDFDNLSDISKYPIYLKIEIEYQKEDGSVVIKEYKKALICTKILYFFELAMVKCITERSFNDFETLQELILVMQAYNVIVPGRVSGSRWSEL